ncbi:MAG: GNAT family N-acetyltransferase [Chloroflexi bacterium]|nr:GNAT family N-acetyltransferase [Chloroflexota bacterium]
MIIRHPQPGEVDAILALFEEEVHAGRMLPRTPENVRAGIEDWLVAERYGQVIGCASLVAFNQELCELRSLAVAPACRGQGIAGQLIAAVVQMARERGFRQVLTLTRAPGLFERVGFRRDFVANYPEKVWRDCTLCPFQANCDEVALLYPVLEQEEIKTTYERV